MALVFVPSLSKKNVLVVCGTRPEIIKMAPVYRALLETDSLAPVLLHTGQHTDLATPVYEFFGMRPDESIALAREKPTLAHLSATLLNACAEVIERRAPAAVLVHGDTSSAAMGALAAFYAQVPVGHVEAGLRTFERYSPFPEEMNRQIIGRIAHWHFAPTHRAAQTLREERIDPASIEVTGNTVIDAAHLTVARLGDGFDEPFITSHDVARRIAGKRLVLVTAHRRENWGEGLRQIADAVADCLQRHEDLFVLWPVHANPAVAQVVREALAARAINGTRLLLCAPIDYSALIWLLNRAWLVLTDSGGIQEEAAALGAPVLVLRQSTERPELIEAGGGVLTGASRVSITSEFERLSATPAAYEAMRHIRNPYGDGTAAQQIARRLSRELG